MSSVLLTFRAHYVLLVIVERFSGGLWTFFKVVRVDFHRCTGLRTDPCIPVCETNVESMCGSSRDFGHIVVVRCGRCRI